MYSPFIPIIVIFTAVIESSNLEDLHSIATFVESLHAVCSLSPAIDKFYQLCQILYNVAALYVNAKEKQSEDLTMLPLATDFNIYLSELGFIPTREDMPSTEVRGEMLDDASQGVPPQAWFKGYRHIIGLLEEDLSQFTPINSVRRPGT
jgi:hypothetical protein